MNVRQSLFINECQRLSVKIVRDLPKNECQRLVYKTMSENVYMHQKISPVLLFSFMKWFYLKKKRFSDKVSFMKIYNFFYI